MGDSYELRIISPTGNDWFQWITLVTEFYNELGADFGLQNHKGLKGLRGHKNIFESAIQIL